MQPPWRHRELQHILYRSGLLSHSHTVTWTAISIRTRIILMERCLSSGYTLLSFSELAALTVMKCKTVSRWGQPDALSLAGVRQQAIVREVHSRNTRCLTDKFVLEAGDPPFWLIWHVLATASVYTEPQPAVLRSFAPQSCYTYEFCWLARLDKRAAARYLSGTKEGVLHEVRLGVT